MQACQNPTEKIIKGWWTIDSFSFENCQLVNLYSNSLFFKDDYIQFPILDNFCDGNKSTVTRGKWYFSKKEPLQYILKIESKNSIYNGVYNVTFYDDEINKLLKMRISSPTIDIIASKGFFNYDLNSNLIKSITTKRW